MPSFSDKYPLIPLHAGSDLEGRWHGADRPE